MKNYICSVIAQAAFPAQIIAAEKPEQAARMYSAFLFNQFNTTDSMEYGLRELDPESRFPGKFFSFSDYDF